MFAIAENSLPRGLETVNQRANIGVPLDKGEGLVGLTRGIGPTQFLSKLES